MKESTEGGTTSEKNMQKDLKGLLHIADVIGRFRRHFER